MKQLFRLIASDIRADRRNPKGLLICVLYRFAHSTLYYPTFLRPIRLLIVAIYKLLTEYILGTEIHWRAQIGPGLRVYHGYGLVVHSNAKIGANCTLRQGVTLGSKDEHGFNTPVIGDDVNIGVSAILIGNISIGDSVIIGAGTVVISDVPANAIVVGNPGKVIRREI